MHNAISPARPGSGPQVAVAVALPGERTLDSALLDQCATRIRTICARKSLEAALEIAAEVIGTFFGGDVEIWRTRSSAHVTFARLCDGHAMSITKSTLSRMLAVYEQYFAMEKSLADRLSFAHHRTLLPVRDMKVKHRLARRVVEERLGKRQLEVLTQEALAVQRSPRRGGRVAAPSLVKAVDATRKAVEALPALSSRPLLPDMAADDQLAVAERMEAYAHQLLATAGHVRGQVDTLRRRPQRW